jgi:hypothetical protein
MVVYEFVVETSSGQRTRQHLKYANDDVAISSALNMAQGRLVEVRRQDRLIATVDERPHSSRVAA